jgi:predicted small lipoprotein YifL
MKRLFSPLALAGLFVLVVLAGCGKPGPKTVPVQGKVTVGDQPVQEGNVSFIPASATEAKAGMSAGQIKNGEYTIYTSGKEGAPEGKYKVTVTPSMVPTGGKGPPTAPFNKKYRDVQSTPLTIDVPSASYDLKLDK